MYRRNLPDCRAVYPALIEKWISKR